MIGIIGAMEEEVDQLIARMTKVQSQRIAGMKYYYGLLAGKAAVIVMCGIGKVNMTVCTQVMIDRFSPDFLINTGVAGSLSAEINIGDMVFAEDAVEHDMDTSTFGDPRGQVPRMNVFGFPCDPKMVDLAEEVNKKVNPDIRSFSGRIATGDQFIHDNEYKDFLVEEFGALCCEMEGAAMAHTAYLNEIPCLIVRSISDKADGTAELDYQKFKSIAVDHEVKLIMGLMEEM